MQYNEVGNPHDHQSATALGTTRQDMREAWICRDQGKEREEEASTLNFCHSFSLRVWKRVVSQVSLSSVEILTRSSAHYAREACVRSIFPSFGSKRLH